MDDFRGRHPVSVHSFDCSHSHRIAGTNRGERLEKGISVCGNSDVSGLSRKGRPGYVARGVFEFRGVDAFYHHDGNADSRDLELPNELPGFGNWRLGHLRNRTTAFAIPFPIENADYAFLIKPCAQPYCAAIPQSDCADHGEPALRKTNANPRVHRLNSGGA
jgi:hypothetical protein